MTITITWNRAEKTAHVPQPRDVMDFFATGEDPAFLICRQMVNVGRPDLDAVVIDEHGQRAWLIRSIQRCAAEYHPTPEQAAERAARAKAKKTK